MARKTLAQLLSDIKVSIYQNANGEVTGQALQDTLVDLTNNLYITDSGKTISSGSYQNGTLTLTFSDGSTLPVSGWTDLDFLNDGSDVTGIDKLDFKGTGVSLKKNGDTLEIQIDNAANAVGNHFVGIFDDLQALQDAIATPAKNMQAIVISPSEYYYHSDGAAWQQLAPVSSFHSQYVGAYDTVGDLQAAVPTPSTDALAIVGTSDKEFYVYDGSKWGAITHTDLPALTSRIATAEQNITALRTDVDTLKGEVANTPKFDPSMFQSAVDHGYAADDQGIKSSTTTDGWWVFKDLKSVSGRPADSVGELFVFKNEIPTNNVALKHVFVMAIGQDQDLENKVWFAYRDGTQWTAWFDQIGSEQSVIDGIKADIAKLKIGDATLVSEVSHLTSTIGAIYAPTKEAFNKAVTTLISAALANYTPVKPGHGGDKPSLVFPRFYAQFSLGVPTDFTGATTSTNAEATLLRIPTTRERIFISVENDNNEASKVTGFKFNNKQEMSLAHRDIVRDGKKYRAFYTSGAFSEQKVDIKVDFGQGV